MISWASPEYAPKDGTPILAVFESYPYRVMAVWCGASGKWCAAVPQVGMYEGELNDWYFENEYFAHDDLKVWADIRPPV